MWFYSSLFSSSKIKTSRNWHLQRHTTFFLVQEIKESSYTKLNTIFSTIHEYVYMQLVYIVKTIYWKSKTYLYSLFLKVKTNLKLEEIIFKQPLHAPECKLALFHHRQAFNGLHKYRITCQGFPQTILKYFFKSLTKKNSLTASLN